MRTFVPSNCSSSIQITQFVPWRHTVALRFLASAVAYKDIWVSIGYVQKHVVARALQAFALARAPRISNASVIHPLSNKTCQVMTCVYQSADEMRATKEQLPHSLSICE